MSTTAYDVEVQSDYLEKITQAAPIHALAELIWNSLDADAGSVSVRFEYDNFNSMSAIVVSDDGRGMTVEEARDGFCRLGGSWKKTSGRTKGEKRFLHGQDGRGRFKSFALGRHAEWTVVYENDSKMWTFAIVMNVADIRKVKITEEIEAPKGSVPGVILRITELRKEYRTFTTEKGIQEITEILALYLSNYLKVKVDIDGHIIDPSKVIVSKHQMNLSSIESDGRKFPVELEIVHWRTNTQRVLYLCNENGFPSNKVDTRFHVGKYQFSAYLKSSYLAKIQADGLIELAEMDELVNLSIEEAQQAIKDYFRKCAADEAHSVVEEWKESKIYPYTGEATTAIETAERQVFDIVAVNVAHYIPEFEKTENKNKALHLQLLKQAIAKSPEDLQVILEEVLKLPKRKQAELAELLRDVSLASIINAAKTVADRLKFLSGLETILFDTLCKKNLKERSQLHRIIAQACWIMGEEYSLSVDDRSLNEVLRKHKKILKEEIVIDEPVKPLYKSRGIVDLMLSKAIKGYKVNEIKHLVVELKAPKVSVGLAEIGQIEEYALAVMNDERFRAINATWTFWVISDDYDDYAKMRMSDDGTGRIDNKKNGNFSIYVKTWAQILEDNRVRLKFFQDRLEYTAKKADAMKFLNDHYAKFLQGVIDDSALTEMNNTEEIESETVTEGITPD